MKVRTTIQGVKHADNPIKLTLRSLWEDARNGSIYELHKIVQVDRYMLVDHRGDAFQSRQIKEADLRNLITNRILIPFSGTLSVRCTEETDA